MSAYDPRYDPEYDPSTDVDDEPELGPEPDSEPATGRPTHESGSSSGSDYTWLGDLADRASDSDQRTIEDVYHGTPIDELLPWADVEMHRITEGVLALTEVDDESNGAWIEIATEHTVDIEA